MSIITYSCSYRYTVALWDSKQDAGLLNIVVESRELEEKEVSLPIYCIYKIAERLAEKYGARFKLIRSLELAQAVETTTKELVDTSEELGILGR